MNWIDVLIAAIIGGFVLNGLKNGFIRSIYAIASFFVSLAMSIKLYPILAKVLCESKIFTGIKSGIMGNFLSYAGSNSSNAAGNIIGSLKFPKFINSTIATQTLAPYGSSPVNKIVEEMSNLVTKFVINVLGVVIVFLGIRIALGMAGFIINGIAKLPIFKQMDKIGGIALGAVQGILIIYIIFAFFMLMGSSPQFAGFFDALDNSLFAKFFYENNLIVNRMFPSD